MMSTKRGRLVPGTTMALLGLAIAAAPAPAGGFDLLQRAEETGKITIGYANAPPYGFRAADGRLTGEAPEIARLILSRMGIKEVQGVLADPASLIGDLKAGRFDMIAAGMLVLPRLCAEVLFSEPTFAVAEAFVVRAGNPRQLETFADVAASEHAIVAVTADALTGDHARAAGVPDERILVVPDPAAGAAAVLAGQADAFAAASPGLGAVLSGEERSAELEQTAPFVGAPGTARGHGAFAFRTEDAAFAAEFNRHLEQFPFEFTRNLRS